MAAVIDGAVVAGFVSANNPMDAGWCQFFKGTILAGRSVPQTGADVDSGVVRHDPAAWRQYADGCMYGVSADLCWDH